jgi:hypothetical protein
MDRTCHSQKPAISSLVSVKGPSVTVGGEHYAGFGQLFIELTHGFEDFPVRHDAGFGFLVGFDDYQASHCLVSF